MVESMGRVDRALRDLAHALETDAPSQRLMTAVMERVAEEPVPQRSALRVALGRWGDGVRARVRWVVGLLLLLALTGAVVSPVGAAVADWFRFHGVIVSTDPDAPTGSPEVPGATGGLTLDEAAALVDFAPSVPAELGPPDDVEVSADRRLLSMSWDAVPGAGPLRLDQFDAEVSAVFWKLADETRRVAVGSHDGLWFPGPHEVVVLEESGLEDSVPPRLAAQTLIWADAHRTFRLEGDLEQARAVEIAESVQ